MLDNPHTHLSGVCKPYQALSDFSLLYLVDSKHIGFGAITERNTTLLGHKRPGMAVAESLPRMNEAVSFGY